MKKHLLAMALCLSTAAFAQSTPCPGAADLAYTVVQLKPSMTWDQVQKVIDDSTAKVMARTAGYSEYAIRYAMQENQMRAQVMEQAYHVWSDLPEESIKRRAYRLCQISML